MFHVENTMVLCGLGYWLNLSYIIKKVLSVTKTLPYNWIYPIG